MHRLASLYIKETIVVCGYPETSLGILEQIVYEVNVRLLRIPEIIDLEFLSAVTVKTAVSSDPYVSRFGLIKAIYLGASQTVILVINYLSVIRRDTVIRLYFCGAI